MGLMTWLKKHMSGDEDAALNISPEEAMLSGLHLKDVLDAHSAWKEKLSATLKGESTEEIEVSTISQDNLCILGKWLYGPGKSLYSNLPEYESARTAHAEFHLCAAEVLIEHQSGNAEKANDLLKHDFRSASNKNQLELVRLFSVAT